MDNERKIDFRKEVRTESRKIYQWYEKNELDILENLARSIAARVEEQTIQRYR